MKTEKFILLLVVSAMAGYHLISMKDEVWCMGNRISRADVIRECMSTKGCKTTPSDLSRMKKIESRCAWQRNSHVE